MPKYVGYELFELEADNLEDAKMQMQTSSTRGGVMVCADKLGNLFHPVHLQEAQDKFGHIQPSEAPAAPAAPTSE